MSDKIKIDLGGIKKAIEEIEEGLKPETIRRWCRKVGELAKKRCDAEISFRAEEVAPGRFEIKARYGSRSELDCLVEVVEENLPKMPVTTRGLFEELLSGLYKMQSDSPAYG